MSDFKINSIATKQGQHGPVIAGVSTINSTGCMKIPSGPTEFRGGRDRGVFAGGYIEPTFSNTIDFITISSTGNATDFGDLTLIRMMGGGGCSNSTRGIIGGGQSASPAPRTNIIDFITIATTGNAVDFGDSTSARVDSSGASSSTRGVFVGGDTPTLVNTIDFVEIATTGNASDFGDQTVMRDRTGGASNGHGGL